MDGFRGYNQVRMAKEDQENSTFVIEWEVFVAIVMMFGLWQLSLTFPKDGNGNL